jgi:drug/metabolite transporter (DMT)-like permease
MSVSDNARLIGDGRPGQQSLNAVESDGVPPPPAGAPPTGAGGEPLCMGLCETDPEDIEFGCVVGAPLLAALVVICGTASTITGKLQYGVRSDGIAHCKWSDDDDHDDDDHEGWDHHCPFAKPWFQTLVMKLAMTLCLFITWGARMREEKPAPGAASQGGALGEALLESDDLDAKRLAAPAKAAVRPTWGAVCFIAIPALTDLLQTVLSQAGLLWVSSSTYQMTRGSVIIFTCALSVTFMGKVLTRVHVASIGIVCVAIVLVGMAGVFSEGGGGGGVQDVILGLLLILVGQVVGAVQFVLEELIMESMNISPTLLVGWEGLWGCLYFVVLAPLLTITPGDPATESAAAIWHEDFHDSWVQLQNSPELIWLTFISAIALLVYNLVGNMVTKQLSAVMRSILESCRTLGVWLASLIIYYGWGDDKSGEKWSNWSVLELAGFVLLVYGTVAYKEIVRIPYISPPKAAPLEPTTGNRAEFI